MFGRSFWAQISWFVLDKLFSAFSACLGLTYFSLNLWVKSAYFKKLHFGAFGWLAFPLELLCIYDNYNIYDDFTHHISHITHHQISFFIASHLSHLLHTTPYIKEFGPNDSHISHLTFPCRFSPLSPFNSLPPLSSPLLPHGRLVHLKFICFLIY